MAVKFIDEARIHIKAGSGGRGCVAFEAVPGSSHKRRPTGGSGGDGGNVFVQGSTHLSTLMDFKYQQHYAAEDGKHGAGKNQTGEGGADLVIDVPLGTILQNESDDTDRVEIVTAATPHLLLPGGRGGRGNFGLKHPHSGVAIEPEEGAKAWYQLELKLMADVGVIGLPNAGKSTLVRRISGAKPKVGAYPFTTLHPSLGVVTNDAGESFVIADIPGLIAGAHQGVGLGNRFLRHIARVRCLVFMVDATDTNVPPREALDTVYHELREHDAKLLTRPRLVLLNKIDQLPNDRVHELLDELRGDQTKVLAVSAETAQGIEEATGAIFELLHQV